MIEPDDKQPPTADGDEEATEQPARTGAHDPEAGEGVHNWPVTAEDAGEPDAAGTASEEAAHDSATTAPNDDDVATDEELPADSSAPTTDDRVPDGHTPHTAIASGDTEAGAESSGAEGSIEPQASSDTVIDSVEASAEVTDDPDAGSRTIFAPPSQPPADQPPPAGDARTVFISPSVSMPAEPASDARTVFVPPTSSRGNTVPPTDEALPAWVDPSHPGDQPVEGFIAGNRTFFPRRDGGGIQVGDILNHMFEVTRFIARGGMGEVFEGLNISSGERVAIKVMLPALAADENVQAMFKREARTLTRLAHPALVAYRVMAQEPQLGVLYIVTEYIDGTNLDSVLGDLKPQTTQIVALGRRLADGLRVAHSLDAIHRDISPDNVLLEDGRLDKAKIIDFGIAKDLDPSNKTIVGDGFAGKLNYVAPEQLGDFGRDVGPWSDVYSLGLVLLAVSRGRDVDMGATLVDAVDRRRSGPDLTQTPEPLRSVLAQMLVADPAQRLRSMDAVIAAFDGAPRATAEPAGNSPKSRKAAPAGDPANDDAAAARRKWIMIGGSAGGLAVVALAALLLFGGGKSPNKPAGGGVTVAGAGAAPSGPADATARAAIAAALLGIDCSWITTTVTPAGSGVNVTAAGVARDSAAAQGAISHALEQGGVQAGSMNFEDVAPIEPGLCFAVDSLRSVQSDAGRLSVQQPIFEMKANATSYQGKDIAAAPAVVTVDPGPDGSNMAFFGIDQGNLQLLTGSRQDFLALAEKKQWAKNADGSRRILNYSFPVGLKGAMLLTSPNPIDAGDLALLEKPPGGYDAAWAQRVSAIAKRQGWKAEIVWYRVVDNVPG